MKHFLIFFFILWNIQLVNGQTIFTRKEDIARNKIKKCIINSTEYLNGKPSKSATVIFLYDSLGRETKLEAYNDSGKLFNKIDFFYSPDGMTKIEIDTFFINNRTITYYRNKTRNKQKVHELVIENGEDTIVDNTDDIKEQISDVKDSVVKYDENNKMLSKILINSAGWQTEKYEYVNNCVNYFYNISNNYTPLWEKRWQECRDSTQIIVTKDTKVSIKGYLFGIAIKHEKGGKSQYIRNKENLVIEHRHTGKYGQLIARIIFTYEN